MRTLNVIAWPGQGHDGRASAKLVRYRQSDLTAWVDSNLRSSTSEIVVFAAAD